MDIIFIDPPLSVSSSITRDEFLRLFPADRLRAVTPMYYTASCKISEDFLCMVGFHFIRATRNTDFRLEKLELYPTDSVPTCESFEAFQRYLIATFGPPHVADEHRSYPGTQREYPSYQWLFPDAVIYHSLAERYSTEETLVIIYSDNC